MWRRSQRWLLVVVACLFVSSGCGEGRQFLFAPAPPAEDFYPLAVGNLWRYSAGLTIQIVRKGDTLTVQDIDIIQERELIGVDSIAGRGYVIEETRLFDAAGMATVSGRVLLRQDDTGLYAADFAADRDTLPVEATLLRYPLEPGARWLRSPLGLPVTLVVEDSETLDLAPGSIRAYRLRREFLTLSPEDFSTVWYGRCGRLRFEEHRETMAKDALTGEVVLIISDNIIELVELHLVDPGACTVEP